MALRNRQQGARKAPLWLIVLALVLGTVMAFRTRTVWEGLCTQARRQLPTLLGLEVGIGQCEVDPLGQRVILRGLSVFEKGSDTPLLAADSAEVQIGLPHPISGKVSIDMVRVLRPRLALDLSRPRTPSGEPGVCPLQPLRRLILSRLAITGAEVRLLLPGGRQVEVSELDVSVRERWGEEEFEVEARRGLVRLGPGQELALGRLALSGGLDVDEELLEVDRAEVSLDDVTVNISGRVEQLCDPVLAMDAQVFLPLRTLSQAGLLPKPANGHLWSRLTVNGRPAAPSVSLELAGSGLAYGGFTPGSLTARLAYAGDVVTVEELTLPIGKGDARVSGTLGLGPGFPVEVHLETRDAPFGLILEKAGLTGSWVDFPANATADLRGTLMPKLNLSGNVDLRTGRFVLATRAFDAPPASGRTLLTFERGHVATRVSLLGDRVSFSDVQLESGGSRVGGEVTLFYDVQKGLLADVHGDVDLSDFGHIAELEWAGRGSMSTTIEGPYSDVKIGASLSLRDFEFWGFDLGVVQGKVAYADKVLGFPTLTGQKGRTQYFGNAALTFGRSLHARAEVEVPRGRTEDLIDIIAGLHSTISVMQGPLVGEASGRVEIDSPIDQFEGLVAFDFKNTTYYGRHMGDGSMRLRFDDGKAMVLERTLLEGRLGRTWVDGSFFFSGPDKGKLDYRFGGDNLSLAELVGPESERLGVSGLLEMEGTVSGNTDLPVTRARVWGPKVTFAKRDLGNMGLEALLSGRDLQVAGRPSRDTSGILFMRVKEPYPFDAAVTLELPEIRPLLPTNAFTQDLSGSVKAVVKAQGALLDAQALQMSATVERLTLSRGQLSGANDGPIALSFTQGRLEVPSFIFRGPETELSAQGWVGFDAMELYLRGSMDLRLLESLSPMLVRTGGRLELNAVANGSPRKPSLVGTLHLLDAKLSLRDQPVSARGLNGRVEFTTQRILVEEMQGTLNEGRVQIGGQVALNEFQPAELQVNVSLTDVATRFHEDLPFNTTGQLWLTGHPDALRLGGALDIRNLRYRRGLELDDILKRLSRRTVLPTPAEKPREYLTLDIGVHLGDVRVDNNLARARLIGSLRVTGTNARLGVLGTVETAESSQAFFRNNQFTVTRGQIEFQDRYGIDPVFDLRAQSQVREYQVKLHAFGRPAAPQVLLTSEPALPEGDLVSLLTLGLTSTDKETAASASAGLAAEAFFNMSGLDRQVQRFIPNNPVLKDLSLQISTTYNDATQQAEPTARLESKFLTERLKIGLTQPVSGRGTRARAEYHFDNRLSLQGQWDNEHSETALGNPGIELKLSWESQ
ncbi:translocation/assembly module TamB [Archangium violaceum]|uniref:translocation/assembly module TamB domain-containing protein n=1 Tax=Archangium violaceum TaxID=83451 RepID=UPI00194E8323|nr:translocation/assembly module TamB domain-containing protein [Archangium violaceum]QRN99718.1 translocation/assembly module TamB [Archangium violaceum]